MRVLIVDDEDMIRNVLKEYVEFEGNEAFEAAEGMKPPFRSKGNKENQGYSGHNAFGKGGGVRQAVRL